MILFINNLRAHSVAEIVGLYYFKWGNMRGIKWFCTMSSAHPIAKVIPDPP